MLPLLLHITEVIRDMFFYGTDLLSKVSGYYEERLKNACQSGLSNPATDFHWLYRELQLRYELLRQVRLFLDSLPMYMVHCTEDEAITCVFRYTFAWFSAGSIGDAAYDDDFPYFTESNPYWRCLGEAMESIDENFSYEVLPMAQMILSEFVIRSLRLYLFVREKCISSIDRQRFDWLMSAGEGFIPSV